MRGASRTVFTPRRRSGSTGWASSSVSTGLVRIENQSSCEFTFFYIWYLWTSMVNSTDAVFLFSLTGASRID